MTSFQGKRALLSVYDKSDLVEFAKSLHDSGMILLASGNTAKSLKNAKIEVTEISDFTGSPEMLEGRVKTLHPKVHGGILYKRSNPKHSQLASSYSIDLVCVNFYPFEETLKKTKDLHEILENIDIGGPSLVRSAAKNFEDVIVVTSPLQYKEVASKIASGKVDFDLRRKLATSAFEKVLQYDAAISSYFASQNLMDNYKNPNSQNGQFLPQNNPISPNSKTNFPQHLTLSLQKIQDLRYGENPHQKAASYKYENALLSFDDFEKLNGKELSYNNLLDIEAALELIYEFKKEKEAVAIIFKHTNPTGAGKNTSTLEAFKMAYSADSLSAFGGIAVFNKEVDKPASEELIKNFMEIVIAPSFSKSALEVFKTKKNLRVIKADKFLSNNIYENNKVLSIVGGLLMQTPDTKENEFDMKKFKIPTKKKPNQKELEALEFAWKFIGHIKSNSVVFATNNKLLAVGAGQQSRVDSCTICIEKARRAKFDTNGAVMASEAFFPFKDTIEFAAKSGIISIIQPGGSIRDEEVITAANDHGISMVITGIRHFRH
ncbi:bifunctional phosphoribosylaminoimidazolecarboxamide formyltransferase/IMP cyclohydrolase [Candidatus Micrarchaeota archaeon]|nr:bifunctional phosphoribosylaminoimidazolecarboxamide formyltransferase/IMP cyclohydrolase [Candidatus Micrarchaeota archaeon]